MAETVYLNDGTVEVVLADKGVFLERLIRERLGYDAAQCFLGYVAEMRQRADLEAERARDFERSADGYLGMCQDARECFEAILELLKTPRMNKSWKKKLEDTVKYGYDDLYKNL